jgi:hypothetical protein
VLAAATAILAVLSPPAAAVTKVPPGSITLTGGKSAFSNLYLPLVGSTRYLVYADQPYPFATETLKARGKHGATSTLAFDISQEAEPTSLAGSSLTGLDVFATTGGNNNVVEWWNLAGSANGVMTMPATDAYLSSAPDGVLAIGPGGALQDHPSAGAAVRKLGTPFATATSKSPPFAVAGDGGVVLQQHNTFVYMAWAHPGTFTTLDVIAAGDTNAFCSSVASGSAGCGALDSSNHPVVIRAPVTGLAPVATRLAKSACPTATFLTATVTAWADACAKTIASVPAQTGTPVSSRAAFVQEGDGLATAYDQLVATVESSQRFGLDELPSASAPRTQIVAPVRSPTVAAHIALTSGRVGYDSDQTAAVTTWSRSVHGSPSAVSVGAATSLGHPGSGMDIDTGGFPRLSLSGANTASAGMVRSLTIRSPMRNTTLVTTTAVDDVDLSGDRVTFDSGATEHPMLYDLRTKTLSRIKGAIAASVWGDYLAYVKADGSVWRRQLDGQHSPVELRKPLPAKQQATVFADVYSFGDEVAWNISTVVPGPTGEIVHDGYRDAQTLTPAMSVPAVIQAATSDGLLESASTETAAHYYLQHYGSTHRSTVLAVPQPGLLADEPDDVAVDGDRIAWIDARDRARLAPLPITVSADQPRYLGDPFAPSTAHPSKKSPWQAFIPLSAALTSCSVTILSGTVAIRTLGCAKSDAAMGDALVHWNGKTAGGSPAAPGTYHWQLTAANGDGSALSADGGTAPIRGRIVVS